MIRRWQHFWALLALVTAVAGIHGWSLGNGLYLDDHAHWETLQKSRWSLRWFAEAARLDYSRRVMRIWWAQDERPIRFFRPGSFAIMKLQHAVCGGRPWGMHLFQLAWHAAVGWLVYLLGIRLLGGRDVAVAAMLLFVLHPALVLAVQWLAPQTLIVTAFFILLCLWSHARADQGGWGWRALTVACLGAALLCREDAVVTPAALMLFDRVTSKRRVRSCGRWYLLFWAVVILYLALRVWALGGFPTPAQPYYHSPSEPGFVSFVLLKTLYYWLGLVFLVPVIPVAGLIYLQAHPLLTGITVAGMVGLVALCLWQGRRQSGQWMGFGWAWLFLLPTVPLFAGSWYLYLPAIGLAWMVAAWLRQLAPGYYRTYRWRYLCGVGATVLLVAAFACLSLAFAFTFRCLRSVEELVVADVATDARDCPPNTQMFFINMPVSAHYAVPAIRRRLGRDDLQGWVLTFAPTALGMEAPCILEPLDAYRFRLRLPGGRYFGGRLGRVIMQAVGRKSLTSKTTIKGELFDVELPEAAGDGFSEITFTFHKPLASPQYRFYYGSRARWAAPYHFAGLQEH